DAQRVAAVEPAALDLIGHEIGQEVLDQEHLAVAPLDAAGVGDHDRALRRRQRLEPVLEAVTVGRGAEVVPPHAADVDVREDPGGLDRVQVVEVAAEHELELAAVALEEAVEAHDAVGVVDRYAAAAPTGLDAGQELEEEASRLGGATERVEQKQLLA